MTIELKEYSIEDIARNFMDAGEEGVTALGGDLIVRPDYQREFVYGDAQRMAVIDTIIKGFPLNVMYWAKREDGKYEVLDGQQRTMSFCQYLSNVFSYDGKLFQSQPDDIQQKILNYKVFIYVCSGEPSEKLAWFKTINIAGEKLTEQELRNAVYTGEWLADAKKHFSKNGCVAQKQGDGYVSGNPIRQELLETALRWVSKDSIEEYMSRHQHESNCNELWFYFLNVIEWVKSTFRTRYKEMKGVEWGYLYNKHKDDKLDPIAITNKVKELMSDEDVQSKKGIFEYVLDNDERKLKLRTFRESERRTAYEKQGGICPICGKHYDYEDMEADHIIPFSKGGHTTPDNLQMLCRRCNNTKSDR